MFSFQPTLQQQQTNQTNSMLPALSSTTIHPQPYPRDTPYTSLPIEIRNALSTLERTVQSHTVAAKQLADTVQSAESGRPVVIGSVKGKVFEGVERVGRLVERQEAARVNVKNCRRLVGQYWRYGESVAAVLNSAGTAGTTAGTGSVNQQQQTQKYANLILPPYDLSLFERIVDRLDGLVQEAETAASNLCDQLEHCTNSAADHHDAILKAAVSGQVAVRQARDRVAGACQEADQDRQVYRRYSMKYKNDSTDPFKRNH